MRKYVHTHTCTHAHAHAAYTHTYTHTRILTNTNICTLTNTCKDFYTAYYSSEWYPKDPVNYHRMEVWNASITYSPSEGVISVSFSTSTPTRCVCKLPAISLVKRPLRTPQSTQTCDIRTNFNFFVSSLSLIVCNLVVIIYTLICNRTTLDRVLRCDAVCLTFITRIPQC